MRALAVVLLMVGCAASHPSDDSDRPDVALYMQIHDAVCARALQCARGAWYDGSEGSDYVSYACDPTQRALTIARIVAGDWTLDTANAHACLAAFPTLGDCVLRTQRIDGLLPPRSTWPALEASAHCTDALVYVRESCGDTTCPIGDPCVVDASCHGTCGSVPEIGDPCVGGQLCGGYRGYCRAPIGTGGTCVELCSIETCVRDGHGHGCLSNACVDGGDAGDACDPTLGPPCQSDLVCDPTSRTCVPITPAPCAPPCPMGQLCLRDGTCSSSADGLGCRSRASGYDALSWIDTCPVGFSCTGSADVCRPVIAAGAACTWDTPCIEGTTCQSGRCATAQLLPQHACATASDCEDGFTCEAARCTPPHGLCATDADCRRGACADGVCRMRPLGAACTTPDECACLDGTCVASGLGRDGAPCSTTNRPEQICAQAEGQFCVPGEGSTAYCCP